MKDSRPKCALEFCARDSNSHGYCAAHALRLTRGMALDTPLRPRGSPRVALADVVAILEHHGAGELADLFRRLGKRSLVERMEHGEQAPKPETR